MPTAWSYSIAKWMAPVGLQEQLSSTSLESNHQLVLSDPLRIARPAAAAASTAAAAAAAAAAADGWE